MYSIEEEQLLYHERTKEIAIKKLEYPNSGTTGFDALITCHSDEDRNFPYLLFPLCSFLFLAGPPTVLLFRLRSLILTNFVDSTNLRLNSHLIF